MSELSCRPQIPRVPFRGQDARRAYCHLMRGEVPMIAFVNDLVLKKMLEENPVQITGDSRRKRSVVIPDVVRDRLQARVEHFAGRLDRTRDTEGRNHAFELGQVGTAIARFASSEDNDRYPPAFDEIPSDPDFEVLAESPVFAMRAMLLGTARVRARRLEDTVQTEWTWSDPRKMSIGTVTLHVAQGTPSLDPTAYWIESVGGGEQAYFEQLLTGSPALDNAEETR